MPTDTFGNTRLQGTPVPSAKNANTEMQTPGAMGIPPTLNAAFQKPPKGSMGAPAVVTSAEAENHVGTMSGAASTATQDAQTMLAHNAATKANAAAAPADATGKDTPTKPDASTAGDSSVDSLLSTLGLDSTGLTDQQKNVVAQDQDAIAFDREIQTQVEDALSSMEAGTFPLTPAEQLQVNAVRNAFTNAVTEAESQAKNLAAGGATLVAHNQLQMYSPRLALGTIQNAIKAGQAKVDEVNNRIVKSMGDLTKSLQDGDYKTATRLYTKIGDDIDTRTKEIDNINKITTDTAQAILKANLDAANQRTTTINSIMKDASAGGAPGSVMQAIANATTPGDAFKAAGDWLQTGTGDVGAYLFAKREATKSGLPAPTYEQFTKALDQQKLNTELAKYRAEQGIKFNYDIALEKAKDAIANQPPPNYNGEFDATIRRAAQSGGTNAQRTAISNDLKTFIANGDYNSAYSQILESAAAKLTGQNRSNFQQSTTDYEVLNDLKTSLTQLKNYGYDTNLLTGTANDISNKIGALTTDSKYAAVAVNLRAAFQNYRQHMTGAAFGVKESAEYASILPSEYNTFSLNMAKIDGAQTYINSIIEGTLETEIGKGGVYIKQYAEAAENANNSNQINEEALTTNLKNIQSSNPKLYDAASAMFTTTNPQTGEPYTADEIYEAFPELKQ